MARSNPLIQGTLILTISGLITRVMGFFYRIFLADALGAEALGIYQLVFPVQGLLYTLFAAGNQTALSKFIAETDDCHHRSLLKGTLLISVSTAVVSSFLILLTAPFLSESMLHEARSMTSLRILALSFPFCAVTACINGFYYGRKKTSVPAATQFVEQAARITIAFFLVQTIHGPFTCEMAVFALLFGEILSFLTSNFALLSGHLYRKHTGQHVAKSLPYGAGFLPAFFRISLPITGNRFAISLLHSAESILLPTFLCLSGISQSEALSLYGILNGMSMPFLLFPATITGSLAVMLLPAVADAHARQNHAALSHAIRTGLHYSLLISILCTGIFQVYGYDMGVMFFHNETAGQYLRLLAWLCPFLYINMTLGSILNGLDRAGTVFLQNIIASSIRLLFLLFLVPHYGISGYLWGMMGGALCLTLMYLITLWKNVHAIHVSVYLIPLSTFVVICGLWISRRLPLSALLSYPLLKGLPSTGSENLLTLFLRCLFVCMLFLPLLWVEKSNRDGKK